MEVCVQNKQIVAVVEAGGSPPVFSSQLECGEILTKHMVSFMCFVSVYNNRIVNLASGVGYMGGQTGEGRAQAGADG